MLFSFVIQNLSPLLILSNEIRNEKNDHWFPNPLLSPQSGQTQVIPLQETPQKFSSMHA